MANDDRLKTDVLRELGFAGDLALADAALQEAGLSRPAKQRINASKIEQVAAVIAERFFLVCSRGDCHAEAPKQAGERTIAAATDQQHCAVCGGSVNQQDVARMIEACGRARWTRLCIVGGSPNARGELKRLVGSDLQLRLIDGTIARTVELAKADVEWADRVVLWGSTQLAHKVSMLYKGPSVISLARRSIAELAREVVKSAGLGR